jgi:dCTP deaminase
MLSAEEICRRITPDDPKVEPLVVVPSPDLDAVRLRNGVSLDVRLGRWFINFKPTQRATIHLAKTDDDISGETPQKEHFVRFGETFTVHPGRFVLAATLEWIKLPKDLAAQILGKSTLGRHGLVIETASGVHPGFTGCLTLEIANLGEVPLLLYPGMEIAQLFFFHVNGGGSENMGNMSGNRKPSVPRIGFDSVLGALRDDLD